MPVFKPSGFKAFEPRKTITADYIPDSKGSLRCSPDFITGLREVPLCSAVEKDFTMRSGKNMLISVQMSIARELICFAA